MKSTVFEHNVCWKCGGAGRIDPFSHVAHGVCFSCEGLGYRLTKRGRADRLAWVAAVDAVALKRVADVKVGDLVKLSGQSRYARVVSLTPASGFAHKDNETGAWIDDPSVTIEFDRKVHDVGVPTGQYASLTTTLSNTIYIHQGDAMPPAISFVSIPKRKPMTAELCETFRAAAAMG